MAENEEKVKNPYELNEPPKPEWLDAAIEKWLSKLDFVVLKDKLEAKKPVMDIRYTDKALKLDWALRKIRQVLNKHGVYTEMSVDYIAYGLELFKAWSRFRPQIWKWRTDWIRELKIIAQKWKNRPVDIQILKEIAILLNCEDILQFL